MNSRFWCGLFCGAILCGAGAAEPTVDTKDLPRFPLIDAKASLKTFTMRPGFHVELAASEPQVVSPVALSIDENGRMYVVEMVDYSERRDEMPHGGRVRLLEDKDGDGVYETSTVFATDLAWPTGIICYHGGVFVAASPDIIWLKDTNGDGKADERAVIYTGFGGDKERLNVQALLNSFNWSLDNRIHGATAPNGGNAVKNLKVPDAKPLNLSRNDFSFDPRTFEMRPEIGGGQYGLSFDSHGRKFVCSNSHHLQAIMYELQMSARNPLYNMPAALVDIPVDGPAAEVYRTSPEEPWRVIRTKWRVSGAVKGMIEGGGRASGYFTGATGATIYRGDAFPRGFLDNAFIGDAGGNLVHRKVIRESGVDLIAERAPDEQTSEFLANNDTWFRPVQMANSPDGCLYVIDMHREIIEHPWSLPESLKQHLDLNSGNDCGRIYRVVPDGFKNPKLPKLGVASTAQLVATLEHPNGWHRDTASRLLYERQDKSAIPALEKLAVNSKSAYGRMHALYALRGLNALSAQQLEKSITDKDALVREHAVRLAAQAGFGPTIGNLEASLVRLILKGEPSADVRYQTAFALDGSVKNPDRMRALAKIAQEDADSQWIQSAVLSSVGDAPMELFTLLSKAELNGAYAAPRALAQMIGQQNNAANVRAVLQIAVDKRSQDPAFTFGVVLALGDGLQRAHASLLKVEGASQSLPPLFEAARGTINNPQTSETLRLSAIQLLGLTTYAESGAPLLGLLDLKQPQSVQLAALSAIDRFTDATVGTDLAQRWPTFTPRLRTEALLMLLKRPERSLALLKAVEAGSVRPTELTPNQIQQLKAHRDAAVKQLAQKVFAGSILSKREDVIKSFQSAMELTGDAVKGKAIYLERCVSCHRAGKDGFALGPDFVTVKNSGKEKLLVNILDPNREVAPQYVAFLVETKDDESVTGIITSETPAGVTIRQAFGKDSVIPRARIARMQSQGQSLMPEGLENGLQPQQLADLLAFIEGVGN